jgi:hypothetical protein
MGDEREDRSGPGQEGFIESTLRDVTITGTGDDKAPPDEPQAAAMPRRGDGSDDKDEESHR